MKKSILFGVLALTSSVFADDGLVAAAQTMNGRSQQQMNDNNMMMNVVTLTSARPDSENGWYVFADPLYWHVDIGSTDWANAVDTSNPASRKTRNHSLNFKWNWGYRIGIGANIDHDMWDTNFYYTWLFADNSNRAGVRSGFVTDEIGIGGTAVQLSSGSIKWDLHFSMFDWELGRSHYVSKSLALRPHVGVKGGWIHQNIRARFLSSDSSVIEKFENDFWGVGPSVGVNTLWVLGTAGKMMDHRVSLFGDFGGALMYGHFDVSNNQRIVSNGVQIDGVNQKGLDRNLAVAMLQGILGLSWDTPFNQEKNHFMMKVGYEFQYWFRQNQLIVTLKNISQVQNHRISDDLSLQGVTAEFRFDF